MSRTRRRKQSASAELASLESHLLSRHRFRDRMMVVVGSNVGFRIKELLSWTVGQVLTSEGQVAREVTVTRALLKGGSGVRKRSVRSRRVVLNERARSAIKYYLATLGSVPAADQFLFRSREGGNSPISRVQAHRILVGLCRDCGVDTTRVPINLSALMRETFEDAEMLGSSRQILMKTDIAENVTVLGDANHLRRILLNLLDNSTKYDVAGGFSQCALTCEMNQAVIRVTNTGPGIPIELRPRVFQRFFPAELSRNSERPGSGLGLSISREIARAHGGDLLIVDSATAGWTEFNLVLPLS